MNTKQIALPLVLVIAVLLAFSTPAAADYSGDHPLVTYEQQVIKGGIVYETVMDGSAYTVLQASACVFPLCIPEIPKPNLTQEITITGIPEGATIKMARLYNYYTWSTADYGNGSNPGMPAEADIWFGQDAPTVQTVCQHGLGDGPANRSLLPNPINSTSWPDYPEDVEHYWDTKGQDYDSKKYDNPSGTFALDVTELVTGNGVYIAKIENNDSTPTVDSTPPGKGYKYWERFATYGFGLLVVYEHPDSPKIEYWIDEGCDYLYNTSKWGVYEPIATTSAPFDGVIHWGNPEMIPWDKHETELITVLTASDMWNLTDWNKSKNMVYFNSHEIGPSIAQDKSSIGVTCFNLTADPHLIHKDNIAYFRDRDLGTGYGDCEVVCNAFLVLEKKSKN